MTIEIPKPHSSSQKRTTSMIRVLPSKWETIDQIHVQKNFRERSRFRLLRISFSTGVIALEFSFHVGIGVVTCLHCVWERSFVICRFMTLSSLVAIVDPFFPRIFLMSDSIRDLIMCKPKSSTTGLLTESFVSLPALSWLVHTF